MDFIGSRIRLEGAIRYGKIRIRDVLLISRDTEAYKIQIYTAATPPIIAVTSAVMASFRYGGNPVPSRMQHIGQKQIAIINTGPNISLSLLP